VYGVHPGTDNLGGRRTPVKGKPAARQATDERDGNIATEIVAQPRTPLSKARILDTAVVLADEGGVDALSMRKIAQVLGVVPMALYKHLRNKDELLDGMVDAIVGEIDPPITGADWKTTIRRRVLSARSVLLRHPWASRVIESRLRERTDPTPAVMTYMNSMIGIFRAGGFSIDLTHHALHAMGSRLLGFSQELFEDTPNADPPPDAPPPEELAERYPHIVEIMTAITHEQGSVVGPGCDDQFEFEFALDLLLDGLDRLRTR
jgi:AcrR family transcriptional regulator